MKNYFAQYSMCFMLALLIIPSNVFGDSYYVSNQGSDNNSGTIDSPFLNLQMALQVGGAADTIFMRGGEYNTGEVRIRADLGMGGANGEYLTIKNYPGEIVSVGGERRIIVESPEYLRIEGLYFRLPYRISGGGKGFQIVNNTFEGPQPSFGAIEYFGDDGLIEGNTIIIESSDSIPPDTKDHAIYLHAGLNNIVRNNTMSGFDGYGIHMYDAVQSGGEIAARGFHNIIIEGNVIMNSRARAGLIIAPDGIEAKNIIIRKNIIINNPINAIRIRYNAHDIQIYNNTFYRNGYLASHEDDQSAVSIRDTAVHDVTLKNNIIQVDIEGAFHIQNRAGSTGIVIERNMYWGLGSARIENASDASSIYADPKFKDAENADFHLEASSPAIDVGLDLGLPYFGDAPDLGALEYGGITTDIKEVSLEPNQFKVYQNYPNPFNPVTKFSYDIINPSLVTIKIYTLQGQVIKSFSQKDQVPGQYTVVWNADNNQSIKAPSGSYFYQITVKDKVSQQMTTATRRMLLLR